MDLQFTAVFRKVPEGYIGFVEELTGANTQGATLEELEPICKRRWLLCSKRIGRSLKRTHPAPM